MKNIAPDFLLIGSGVAGLRAAISASRYGRVLILNKGGLNESSSQKAQGGVAAVLNAEEGEIDSHYQDTIDAGRGLCHDEAVRVLVEEGPNRILELIEWGATFDKIGSQFATVLEGAHRKGRILRAQGDATGAEIVKTLVEKARKIPNLIFSPNHFAIDLIVEDGICQGAWVLDQAKNTMDPILARGVVLATGGAGQVFSRTTNPTVVTGDGIAMAIRAGAMVSDMEFVQFHPTSLFLSNAPAFLLSEAMRGEGGLLRNSDGKLFMAAYHPDSELAPRDIVTRAIWHQMRQGQSVFLDLTHMESAYVRERFPTIDKTCREYGVDIACDKIPVAPAAHYMMGGIKTDLFGRTSLNRLWAAGEVATTGVHGANRLASNALLEGLVFGARVGDDLKNVAPLPQTPPIPLFNQRGGICPSPLETYYAMQKCVKDTMWHDVGIIRSAKSLERAMKQIKECEWVMNEPLPAAPTNKGEEKISSRLALETRNLVIVAAAIITAARARKESIGAHFLEDS
ncbi:MAG: L-aspartate oxidase [Nitrospirae bacterium]|nr:L-aspartate oxidase [Candidatus Troglogloeales bacterium]MBI3598549.1 L-aspartate oxidase [Candidatus Troglogloeales bacterium]